MDLVLYIDSLDLPRISITQPKIRDFALIAIMDDLLEDAVIVSYAISPGRIVESRHRVKETCSQSSQATVTQSSIYLLLIDVLERVPQIFQSLFVLLFNIEITESILKTPSNEELQRYIVYFLGIAHIEGSMGVVETLDESVSDRVCDCLVAMSFLEIESGSGECVFHMVDNSKDRRSCTIFGFLTLLWRDRRP